MDKITIRDRLPNLNEFCSEVSTKLIKWLKDNKLPYNLKKISEREDIKDLIDSCPDIMFMVDCAVEVTKDSYVMDEVCEDLINIAYSVKPNRSETNPTFVSATTTLRKFMRFKGIDRSARARIIVSSLTQTMYWAYAQKVSIEQIRKLITLCLINKKYGYIMNDDFTLWKCNHVNDPQLAVDGTHTMMEVDEKAIKTFLRTFIEKESSVETFYNWGLPMIRERKQQRTHTVVERYFNKYYTVVNIHRDDREDCCDDAGWLCAITEKDGKYRLYILFITYNLELDNIVFDEDDLFDFHVGGSEDAFIDCKTFDTLEDVQKEIDRFMGYLPVLFKDEDEDYWDLWDDEEMEMAEERLGVKFNELEKDWIRALSNAYEFCHSDIINNDAMLSLTKSEYVPNITDPYED